MRLRLDPSHVATCARWYIVWLVWVGLALVLGARLGPRTDEIYFAVVTLPLTAFAIYVALSFVVALAKVLWPARRLPVFVSQSRMGAPPTNLD
jgi:hypothetical protein